MSEMKLRDACLQTLEVTTSPATRDRDNRAFKHVPGTDRGDVVRVAFNIPVPQKGWIDFLTRGADIFGHDYIGHWSFGARPVDRDDLWLVIEHEVLDKLDDDAESGVSARDAFVMEVALIFGSGKKLPKGVHLLDAAVAAKAFAIGCLMWGVEWMNGPHNNADGYDGVLQLALLGEFRYG